MVYQLLIKNDRTRNYVTLRILLSLANFLAFLVMLFMISSGDASLSWPLLGLFASLLNLLMAYRLRGKIMSPQQHFMARFLLFLGCLSWAMLDFWWLAAGILAFVCIDYIVHQPFIIEFSERSIRFPSSSKGEVEWSAVQRVILKDGLLTIDFHNNRIFQQPLAGGEEPAEQAFNQFCGEQIRKSSASPEKS